MITYNNLPVFELVVPEEEMGVYAISLVDKPATETQWLAFSEEIKFSLDSDKQIISAPLMLANTPIYRKDKMNGEHYIVFTQATLERMAINFFKNNVREFNEMHNSAFGIDNATVVESWLKTSENDKSVALGFKDVPVGSWFISVFIDDKQYWEENIKSGKFKGFSLEGFFEKVQLSAEEPIVNETEKELNDFVNKLDEILKSDLSNKDLIAQLKYLL
jgi:hypothetical protein